MCIGKEGRKWIYHGEVSQRGCWTGRARGCSVLPASTSAPARSPPALHSSGSGSCDWPPVGTCESSHRAGLRRDWWGKRAKCPSGCWPPPSGSRGWRKYPGPGKQRWQENEATNVHTSNAGGMSGTQIWTGNGKKKNNNLNFGVFINELSIQCIL